MKQKILNLVYIIIGNIFIALAVNTLILENHIIVGGTSGIGNVLNHYFNIPVSLSVFSRTLFHWKEIRYDNITFHIPFSNYFTIL